MGEDNGHWSLGQYAITSVVDIYMPGYIAHKSEPPRDRKKEKNIKHTGNVSLDEIYNVSTRTIYSPFTPSFTP